MTDQPAPPDKTRPELARWLRAGLPLSVSLAVHAALLAAIALLTAGVVKAPAPRERARLAEAEIVSAPASPPTPSTPDNAPEPQTTTAAQTRDAASLARVAASEAREASRAGAASMEGGVAIAASTTPRPAAGAFQRPAAEPLDRPRIAFAGLQAAEPARRITYVVDASGAMLSSLTLVLERLERSIDRLQPTQSVQIILLGKRPEAEEPIRTPPLETSADGWLRATPANRRAISEWLETVTAGGRSNPLDGLRRALELEPDLVFLLSRSIPRSGPNAAWGAGRDAILRELDRLNPIDPRTGYRPVVIKTIQFINPDPTGLLEQIGLAHGDGAGSFRLLTLDDLGRAEAEPQRARDTRDPKAEALLASAREALANVEASGVDLITLLGLPTPDEQRAVRNAADRAIAALRDAPPATGAGDMRIPLLRARAWLLRAAGAIEPDHRRDAARAALAEAQAIDPLDPKAAAWDRLIEALAQFSLDQPASARRAVRGLTVDARDFDLPAQQHALIEIAAARLGLRDQAPEVRGDAFMRSLGAQAVAAARIEAGADPRLVLEALPKDQPVRIAQVVEQLLARGTPRLSIPAGALLAHARVIADRRGRFQEAIESMTALGPRAPIAYRDAARLLAGRGADERASSLYQRFAQALPDDPGAPDAAARAVALASDDARPSVLAWAIEAHGEHARAPAWKLELAALRGGRDALPLLRRVDPEGPLGERAAQLRLSIIDDVLRLGATTGKARIELLLEAIDVAMRIAPAEVPRYRLELGRDALTDHPERAHEQASRVVGSDHATGAERLDARLLRARAYDATGETKAAFEDYGVAAEALDDRGLRDQRFWRASTRRLEIMAERGGEQGRERARQHAIALSLTDPELGGEPWAPRLRALMEADADAGALK